MKTLTLLAIAALPCMADEVVLKDGTSVEFRILEDTGDTYIITTPEGARKVVKRADVESFRKTQPSSPLTGAAVTFDKKAKLDTVDLLKIVDTDKGIVSGTWKVANGVLSGESPSGGSARLQIAHTPAADEYNLTITVERTLEGDNVCFSFPVPGGGQCMYGLDIDMGAYHGVLVPDAAGGYRRVNKVMGKQLQVGKPKTIVFMVRKSSFVVQIEGKDVFATRQDWAAISSPMGSQFAIAPLKTNVKVSRMFLTYPVAGGK